MTAQVVIDTSALLALLWEEAESDFIAQELQLADERLMSAGTLQEFLLVLADRERRAGRDIHGAYQACRAMIEALGITVLPVTDTLAEVGAIGTIAFRSAPASLNFGDGFAYALSKSLDAPLLCKGNDFVHTDVRVLRPD